jgi:hypothetical protein
MQDNNLKEIRRSGQPIHWYVVDIMWQTRRGKKMSIHKWHDMECVSRAKTLMHLNKDQKALNFLEDQTKLTAKKENFRVFNIKSQKIVGYSEIPKEDDYANEWG